MKNVLIVGNGLIGKELAKQLGEKGISSTFFTSRDDRHLFAQKAKGADVIFITISTRDRGQIALGYILEALNLGHPVVTCEKGALAYNFSTLREYIPRLGFNAVVGGGSGILKLLRDPVDSVTQLYAVINGTLNFLFSTFDPKVGIEPVLTEAKRLGLCEPGAGSLEKVVKQELTDVLRKMTVLSCFVINEHATPITPDTFVYSHIDDYDIPALLKSGKRFVVSMTKKRGRPLNPGISARIDGWVIQGGFIDPSEIPSFPFPFGANNLMQCYFGENKSMGMISGPGAGAEPTAKAMIEDAYRLTTENETKPTE